MKSFKYLLLSSLLTTLTFASDVSNESLSQLKAFKEIGATVNKHQLIGKNLDVYLVKGIDAQGREFTIVTDKNGDYLFLTNNVYDVKKQKPIEIPVDISILKNQELLTFGTGKDVYYVFTDPQCPYCQRFEETWDKLKDKATLKILFFNLDFHQDANAMSRWILSASSNDEKIKRLRSISKGNSEYKNFKLSEEQINKLDAKINHTKELGIQLGVQGTPAVFDANGHSVVWSSLTK